MKFKIESFEGEKVVLTTEDGQKLVINKSEISESKKNGDEVEAEFNSKRGLLNELLKI